MPDNIALHCARIAMPKDSIASADTIVMDVIATNDQMVSSHEFNTFIPSARHLEPLKNDITDRARCRAVLVETHTIDQRPSAVDFGRVAWIVLNRNWQGGCP